MTNEIEAGIPKVELATKDWTMKELMDTERRIERAFHEQTQFLSQKTDGIQKAFHEQTQFLSEKNDDLKREFANTINVQTRWMIGLVITMTIAIILAVLFKS